jgi:tRNA A-37 threonylcarbamoyl transferase component Bud32
MPLTAFSGTERFELIRRLGEGGFGIVYEALDRKRSARVALKVLREAEGINLYRFKREFRALADISHENLVGLDELLTDGHHWFFTMELVNGVSLVDYARPIPPGNPADRRRRSDSVLDEARVRAALPQLVAALNAIHRLGIVHCDIKPSNVLVTPDGRVVVLDFGLVSENVIERDDVDPGTWNTDVLGTPAYMAPEQVIPGAASSASDWYSVGVMLYQTLTGQLPFAGSNVEILEAKQDLQPRPPSEIAPNVPKDLSALAMKLLEPDPLRRPDADALIRFVGNPSAPVSADAATTGTEVLVGRDRQLEDLAEAFETAAGGETVVALVSGASGMGKTALVRHFLNEQRLKEPAMLALTGRCYERESMPYKAIDPLIDALAQHLQRLRNIEAARLLPRDAGILARLFPVLMGVEEIRRAPHPAIEHLDSLAVRRRAAEALRDLLCALAERAPLVLFIDDVQWGDADSAAILQQVLRQPDGPALLLVAACRSEDAASAVLVRSLRETAPSQIRDVGVDRLSQREARELAAQLVAGSDGGLDHAEAIARHAAGSPLFVHQIAQHALALGTPMRFDALVRERIESLSEGAQDLMTAVSLSAQPIPPEVAEVAAGLSGKLREPLQLLRASRLVRTDASADRHNIESYHDRIREAAITELGDVQLQDWHARLAIAWEQSGLARPETLVTHYRAAGDDAKTTQYAQVAAERATTALAFDRAAEFFELLATLERDGARKREWLEKHGEALVNAGEGRKAADAFRAALEFAEDEDIALRLQTRQAAELIRAAYVEDAMVVLRSLLPKVGVSVPETDRQAFRTLKMYYALLRTFGTRMPTWFVRPGKRRELLRRVDVLAATSAPLCFVSLVQGNALNVQAAWHAVRLGEPKRLVMALTALSGLESARGTRFENRALDLIAEAHMLSDRLGDPWMKGRTQLASGIFYKMNGRWKEGVEALDTSIATFAACRGVRWEIETANTLRYDALYWMGEWERMGRELPSRRTDAEQRGDRYTINTVSVRFGPVLRMATDQYDRARKEFDDSSRLLPEGAFVLLRRLEVCSGIDLELYARNPSAAHHRLTEAWPKLAAMCRVWQNGRIELLFYRARIALALAAQASNQVQAEHALARALADADLLGPEAPWAEALASLVRASVRHATGEDPSVTIGALDASRRALTACHMHHYAAAADFRRGTLMDNDAGRDLVKSASDWMASQNMMNAARMADLLAPGPWTRRDIQP